MWRLVAFAMLAVFCVTGCGAPTAPGTASSPPTRTFTPIDASKALLWDRMTTETADVLKQIMAEMNAQGGLPVETEYVGGYSEIYRKVRASIQAGTLPAMAVAYGNMVVDYARAGAVTPFEPFLTDPQMGLSAEELADFQPAVLETCRYPDFGGKMYSFPFAKSVLVMYFNKKVLADAGFSEPPKTWNEFLDQCRKVKAKIGGVPFPMNIDCSTVNSMIFSMGGEVLQGRQTLYDSSATLKAFKLIEALAQEGLAAPIPPDSYDDRVAVAQGRAAFAMRSSSHKANMEVLMKGDRESWGIAMIPQDDPTHPRTVLYGPDVVIFNTTPEQQRAAWNFIRHFSSKETSVRWALGTGYIPVRKSAAEDPRVQEFWAQWPYNRVAFDALSAARPEPTVAGWEKVRNIVEQAETKVLTRVKTADEALVGMKQAADAALAASAAP